MTLSQFQKKRGQAVSALFKLRQNNKLQLTFGKQLVLKSPVDATEETFKLVRASIVLELQKQANHGYPDLDLCSNSTAMQSDSVGLLDLS